MIADDHAIVRRGIRLILDNLPQKYHYIEATTCAEVHKALYSHQVKYAVLDMYLTDGNVFANIEQDPACYRNIRILAYSMNAERIYGPRLIKKGVRGFINKQASIEELETALRALMKGEVYLSDKLKEILLQATINGYTKSPIDFLSDRELEVVEYVAAGIGSKAIAHQMNIDITTVSTYRRRAFEKLDVQNAIELKEKFLAYKM